jgi:hypothetical protein
VHSTIAAVLVEVSPEQRTLVLRGMWTVATATGTEAPSDADRAALVAANTFVFRATELLDDWYRPSAEAVRAACSGRYRRGDADAPARAGGHAPRPARS